MNVPAQTDLLYGTGDFRIRLIALAPGECVVFFEVGQKDWLALDEGLNVKSPEHAERAVGVGQHAIMDSGADWKACNTSGKVLRLLEVAREPQSRSRAIDEVTEVRPWGSFTVLKDEPDFKLKQLMVTPGKRLSLQRHQQREEHWLVLAGTPEVQVGDEILHPAVGEYVKIPLHAWHRLSNPGTVPIEIVELQLGEYFGEDDIERREDDFGRA